MYCMYRYVLYLCAWEFSREKIKIMGKVEKEMERYRILKKMREESKSLSDMEEHLQGLLPDNYFLSLEAWVDRDGICEAHCKIFYRKN